MTVCDNTSFTAARRPIPVYISQQLRDLTPSEREFWILANKKEMLLLLEAEDKEFLKEQKINVTRLVFFLVHEWISRFKQAQRVKHDQKK